MTEPAAGAPVEPVDPVDPLAHVHDYRVVSVDFDGGRSTEELRCEGCDGTWFR